MRLRRTKLRCLNNRNLQVVENKVKDLEYVNKPYSIFNTYIFRLVITAVTLGVIFPATTKGLVAALSGAVALATCSIFIPTRPARPADKGGGKGGGKGGPTWALALLLLIAGLKFPPVIFASVLAVFAISAWLVFRVAVRKHHVAPDAVFLMINALISACISYPAAYIATLPGLDIPLLFVALTVFSYTLASQLMQLVGINKQITAPIS